MNAPEPTAPLPEPGRYVTRAGHTVEVLSTGAEVWVRFADGSREWWSHARWRRAARDWRRA